MNLPIPRIIACALALTIFGPVCGVAVAADNEGKRQTICLDGTWQIAEGGKDTVPTKFEHAVPVPGLVDLATPAFKNKETPKDSPQKAFWYRRTFKLTGPVPAVARLKVGKAMYGTRVILNGKAIGDHAPCFTPGWFDTKDALKEGENELIVRIGADRRAVEPAVPAGFDYEKVRYIPGIFDSVELILSGTPTIINVQVGPNVAKQEARVRVWLKNVAAGDVAIEVRETKSGKLVGKNSGRLTAGPEQTLDLVVPIADCRLWTPETPFLYTLTARTAGDEFTTRFGMREFKFDPATGRAMLNGKPYFLRGSNITLYRFFEDADRADLPWREDWVRLLHQKVKDMHWNSLRYCIGFPPEMWYRIADEVGVLIQDEFPIWHGGSGWGSRYTWPKELKTDELAKEFTEWMQERWNHPCVMVWDASNETTSDEIGPAIARVRGLDLSARPWDNSYMPPAQPGDVLEEHPYHFINPSYKLRQLATANPAPWGKKGVGHGVIINEYGWLWLNRDGTPTTLTKKLYENLLGKNSTTEQRLHLQARYLAAETEFWRAHRSAAAVMHFCALGYSRPDGQTSDHWLDVKKLTWEPEFYRYVRDSFAPVGLMIDAWAENYPPAAKQKFPVMVTNDLDEPWKGEVTIRILRNGKSVVEQKLPAEVAALGTARLTFTLAIPEQPGDYQVEATLAVTPVGTVRSLRDFTVMTPEQREARRNLALNRPVKASSVLTKDGQTYRAEFAVDGQDDTRWSSDFKDPQWLAVDLGEPQKISRVELQWERASAKAFTIEVSSDGETWQKVFSKGNGDGRSEIVRFTPTTARWVRITGTQRTTPFGYSLHELGVYR